METLVFRSSIRTLWAWGTVCGGIPPAVLLYLADEQRDPSQLILALLTVLLAAALFAIGVACFPVYVRPDGLRSYNFCGIYRTLPWDAIAKVHHEAVFGFRYLVISDAAGERELWVPLYLSDMPGLAAAIRGHVGPEHPLAEALKGYLSSRDRRPRSCLLGRQNSCRTHVFQTFAAHDRRHKGDFQLECRAIR
jgi:hypothetical protein